MGPSSQRKIPIERYLLIGKINGECARDNKRNVKTFADHMKEVFMLNEGMEVMKVNIILEKEENRESNEITLVTLEEGNNRKSKSEFGVVSDEIIKMLPRKVKLINATFRKEYVLSAWKIDNDMGNHKMR